jgi:parallel beta-helix repeat protein
MVGVQPPASEKPIPQPPPLHRLLSSPYLLLASVLLLLVGAGTALFGPPMPIGISLLQVAAGVILMLVWLLTRRAIPTRPRRLQQFLLLGLLLLSLSAVGGTVYALASTAKWVRYLPALFVDKNSWRAFKTIQAAINAAPPSMRIVIRPGDYKENLLIEKPVELVGVGERSTISIDAATQHPTVYVQDTEAFLHNLTLVGGPESVVYLHTGKTTLEDCEVECERSTQPCVVLSSGTHRLHNNQIHGGRKLGVLIFSAHPVLEENEIFSHGSHGVGVLATAKPQLLRNRIHGNGDAGIRLEQEGLGKIEANQVYENREIGISIAEASAPEIVNNDIHDNRQGIRVEPGGAGTIRENRIFNNVLSGVHVTMAKPSLVANEVFRNGENGIYIFEKGGGLVDKNKLHDNGKSGIRVADLGSTPTLSGNDVSYNGEAGIHVSQGASGLIQDNNVYANHLSGLMIETGADPEVRLNKIHHNREAGIRFLTGLGRILENTVYNNELSGLILLDGSRPLVERNNIRSNNEFGIKFKASGGMSRNNELHDNKMGAIKLTAGANPRLIDNLQDTIPEQTIRGP